ncbi:proteophosphoglycan ppg4 [Lentinula edodes]|uniref:Proteophosphoglycan ppg4 n=1 Tax=Lentinula edodes TaxID=5353 RepID=A0A1Q3EGN3_LENED|nr:proteophosphoglycan ppg4 [Lentinula edodes]
MPRLPPPRFRSRGVNFDLMRNPSPKSKLYFYLSYVLLFAHIPLQTFFDFNAVFILIEVSKYPNPKAPGVPGSGKNWALGAAAYIACWLVWILVVCIVYELVYSFIRRWRTKRPAIYPIYLSSPAFTFASLTSYSNFCFLQHLRYTAFFGEHGGIRDGLAETFWFYSQNLPTVSLLLPRAGLSLALLLSFSSPGAGNIALADAGISLRDATFFRDNGALTDYAQGVLIANAAWTAWKILVLFTSWVGLWVVSGQGCAGLCGPRYRWEEEDAEKTITSMYSADDLSEREQPLPWLWKENTRMRILDAYDFCCVTAHPLSGRWGHHKKLSDMSDLLGTAYPLPMPESPGGFEGMDRLMAAVGLPSESHTQPRRGILSDDLFQQPEAGPSVIRGHYEVPADLAAVIPKVVQRTSRDKDVASPSAPLMKLPYPFTASGAAQVSSDDEKIPFPPSPSVASFKESSSGTKSRSKDHGTVEEEEVEGEEAMEGDDEEAEEAEEVDSGAQTTSEDPSSSSGSGRASNSMSSLGHPVSSRYPFQFRHPTRGASYSSGVPSHATPPSNGHSIASRFSQNTRSTGNRESTDSHSPRSHYTTSDAASPISMSGLPMPPRHPQQYQGRGRARAGTVPVPSVPSSPSIDFPRRARVRTRTSDPYNTSSPEAALWSSDLEHEDELEDDSRVEDSILDSRIEDSIMEQPEPEGSQEAAEGEDVVGLSASGSDGLMSSQENYTFGQPLPFRAHQDQVEEEGRVYEPSSPASQTAGPELHGVHSKQSLAPSSLFAPSERVPPSLHPSEVTMHQELPNEPSGFAIPVAQRPAGPESMSEQSSPPDISTAAASFVTAPATLGSTDESGRTPPSWNNVTDMVDRSDGTWRPA